MRISTGPNTISLVSNNTETMSGQADWARCEARVSNFVVSHVLFRMDDKKFQGKINKMYKKIQLSLKSSHFNAIFCLFLFISTLGKMCRKDVKP